MKRKMEAVQRNRSIMPFALGFGAGAVLLGSIVSATFKSPSAKLEERLHAAEALNTRLEKHNDRLRDEVVNADIRFKILHDRLQSSNNNSLTEVVKPENNNSLTEVVKPELKQPITEYVEKKVEPARQASIKSGPDIDSLIKEMEGIAYLNYDKVKEGKTPLYSRRIKPMLIRTAKKYGLNVSNFEELKSFFEKQGKYLLVANYETGFGLVCNIHLNDIVSKEKRSITVDDRTFSFNSFCIGESTIKDFTEYDSEGRIYITCLLVENDIVHNMKLVNGKAKAAWYIFRYGRGQHGIEFLDKIARAEFRGLYNECTRKYSSEKDAKAEFERRVAELYMKDADINEAYHMSVRGTRFNTNDIDENVRSVYFNYIHTPLRQACFYSEVQGLFNAKNGSVNNKTAKIVFTEFIEYIREKQKSGRFNNIRISGNTLENQMQNLYLLTGDEIKEIAKHLYEKRVARFRNN